MFYRQIRLLQLLWYSTFYLGQIIKMADRSGQSRHLVFCHACHNEWHQCEQGLRCPACNSECVELVRGIGSLKGVLTLSVVDWC